METKIYKVITEISGETNILNAPINIRLGDTDTPVLDVIVKYRDINGTLKPLNLNGKKIYFECVTPAGFSFIDDGSVYNNLKVLSADMGRFSYLIPSAAKAVKGVVGVAYFRFESQNADYEFTTNKQSGGNFSFEIVKDAITTGAGVELFHSDVKKLGSEFINLKETISKQNETINNSQKKLFTATKNNLAVWDDDGNTTDINLPVDKILFQNKNVLESIEDVNGNLTYKGESIVSKETVVSATPPSNASVWIKPL